MAHTFEVFGTTPYTRGSQEGVTLAAGAKLPQTTTTSCRRWAVDREFVYIERTGRTDGRRTDGRTDRRTADGRTDGGRTDGRTRSLRSGGLCGA